MTATSDHDQVPVAEARPHPRADSRHRTAFLVGQTTSAGLVLVVVIALCAWVGYEIGALLDLAVSLAIIGGFVGVLLGFTGVYLRYRDL